MPSQLNECIWCCSSPDPQIAPIPFPRPPVLHSAVPSSPLARTKCLSKMRIKDQKVLAIHFQAVLLLLPSFLLLMLDFSMGRTAFGRQCVIIDNRDDIIMFKSLFSILYPSEFPLPNLSLQILLPKLCQPLHFCNMFGSSRLYLGS